jgi:hypothetical protein
MLRLSATEISLPKVAAIPRDAFSAEWLALLECATPESSGPRLIECLRKPVHWPLLLTLGEEQGVLPLLTKKLGELDSAIVPPEIQQKLQDASRIQWLFTLRVVAEMVRLLDRFGVARIDVMLTKGPVLSLRCSGDSGLRQYTDLDLIVRDADVARATEAMITLGYEPKVPLAAIHARKAPGEYAFSHVATKLLVELHTERTFRYHPKPLPVEKLFERRSAVRFGEQDIPALSVEDELLLICIHGAKHFWERLMWIADVAALVSRQTVDWDRAMAAAREVKALRMLRMGLLLARNVADARLPNAVAADIHSDSAAVRMAAHIARRLPTVDREPLGLWRRAAFRIRMRGGWLQGPAYLLRLSLSPAEEDWVTGSEQQRRWMLDAIRRPLRLARKYGRGEKP